MLATDLVSIRSAHPGIRLDIRYATTNNFTGRVLYDSPQCFLQRPVAQQLGKVQTALESQGLGLKVFDGYRPLSVQKQLWAVMPDERYVAPPEQGSRHNRGAAVDLTLVDTQGRELAMPTPYDDFTEKAHRDFQDLPKAVLHHRALLEQVMSDHDFLPLPTEWWHFDHQDWASYTILDLSFSELEA